jgi:hypothetical protein
MVGSGVVRSCQVDLVDITKDVCQMQSGERLCIERERVERVERGSQVALDEALVFVYLRKLHHSGLFYYSPQPLPTHTRTDSHYCAQ